MPNPTVLLVARHTAIIETVRGALASFDYLNLDICPDIEQACPKLGRVHAVLVHLPAGADDEGVMRLLRAVAQTRRPCATVVLAELYREDRAAALLRAGAADFLALPADLA